jgi:hypothetical protein
MNILSNLLGGNKGMGGQLQVTVVQARGLARKDLFCTYLIMLHYLSLLHYFLSFSIFFSTHKRLLTFCKAKSDPYCILRVGRKHDFPLQSALGTHYKTSVINNNQDPIWNQSFSLPVSNSEQELLKVQVYDEVSKGV